jgi:hypothetical protein
MKVIVFGASGWLADRSRPFRAVRPFGVVDKAREHGFDEPVLEISEIQRAGALRT